MATLKQRIDELETKMPTVDDEPTFIHFVGLDGVEPMTKIVRFGLEWLVQPGETDEAFMARVVREDDLPLGKNCGKVYCCY